MHDFSYVNDPGRQFKGSLSLNAVIFTAVLLSSRLASNEEVFAFIFSRGFCYAGGGVLA